MMRTISIVSPRNLTIGAGCATQCADDLLAAGLRRIFIVTSDPIVALVEPVAASLRSGGAAVEIFSGVNSEPSVSLFEKALVAARAMQPDGVIGFGGGSPMDTAKGVAALWNSEQTLPDVFGIDLLQGRSTYLACIPTTSGTGSEVTPYAIFHHEEEQLKKGVVSPHIVPDASYVDPELTRSVPPAVTAATGMDAMTHCIEAYVNKYAHPMVDTYALSGIKLIADNLARAVEVGDDLEARTALSLGSLYGGLCLGPVNTGAVHALAYPLGGEFHVAHGVSNSVLLPHVAAFNLPATPQRYADIAVALGVMPSENVTKTAELGIERIKALSHEVGIPAGMAELDVPEEAIPRMAQSAMKVTRLLHLNPREVTVSDAEAIYRAAY
jgi:alcohol dehydrogenase class IV